jgi:hypothetical protein
VGPSESFLGLTGYITNLTEQLPEIVRIPRPESFCKIIEA